MNKKKIVMISMISLSLAFLLGVVGADKFNGGYKITITNNTDKTAECLELKYKVGNTIQTISQIEPHKSWRGKIDTNTIQGENSIILTYKDNNGNSYEECVVGYLEKGYEGQANVVINKN
ncbi:MULTISPECIES: hypothetical protein [Desulfosporosinus]|uniref:Uncharacterized protein n=1 Tax=Desulfosporosinus acididurans TaxID=476652 RepID=A0A0J1FK78_9FIRM|nr:MULTISPECIES: hypothetical protein [Desulfosporosinus]KLU63865.1 hypothetical protein DEAC_c42300 [Desulfosporosinus acididurans]